MDSMHLPMNECRRTTGYDTSVKIFELDGREIHRTVRARCLVHGLSHSKTFFVRGMKPHAIMEAQNQAFKECFEAVAGNCNAMMKLVADSSKRDDTDNCDECEQLVADHGGGMSCPDGAYICRECFNAGKH